MSDKIFPVPKKSNLVPLISEEKYSELYRFSIDNPKEFWGEQALSRLNWIKRFDDVLSTNMEKAEFEWFSNGKLNACFNCVDKHLENNSNDIAFIWESDDGSTSKKITYKELYEEVCRLSNLLKSRGIKKGDRVCIYMPMILEAIYSMLACARIGAVHSVVFGGFSVESLKDRILDSDCQTIITANEGLRGGKKVPLKNNVDSAVEQCPNVHTVIVVKNTDTAININPEIDVAYSDVISNFEPRCECEPMDSEDPLFILYTSGSTGKPKGVLHTTAGYLLSCGITHELVFNYRKDKVYWCTADVGWITGHTYIVYGPLMNCATSVIFEGVPTYPDYSRFWDIVDKYKVNIFYTAPTAIRALMAQGDKPVKKTNRGSLEVLGTVGEPINPEAWEWYFNVVGNSQCPIVDTWWQTETGAMMITGLAALTAQKPGSASKPFLGVNPVLLDENGKEISGAGSGNLAIKDPWPSQIRSVYGDHQRCIDTYFKTYPGYYFTGDGAKRDEDGYFWITGRVDDVLNVSGHRLGTAEIESALVLHEQVAEAAVVGYEHEIKGQGIYCYVTLMIGSSGEDSLKKELVDLVAKEIGAIAKPDIIQFSPDLPKTRSGKIMRRILRKIAANEIHDLGDTTTLADPSVVDHLINNRLNK
jgi:acetyl-CoA synthetase